MILFIWHSGKGKTTGTENRSMVARGWGWGIGLTTKEHKKTFGMLELLFIMVVIIDCACIFQNNEFYSM